MLGNFVFNTILLNEKVLLRFSFFRQHKRNLYSRLCGHYINSLHFRQIRRPILSQNKVLLHYVTQFNDSNDFTNSENVNFDLIIFNSYKQVLDVNSRKQSRKKVKINNTSRPLPVFLQSVINEEQTTLDTNDVRSSINFPYATKIEFEHDLSSSEDLISESTETNLPSTTKMNKLQSHVLQMPKFGKRWMNDYEKYTEEDEETESVFQEWQLDYGVADANVPVSKIPCGGCGAFLHCQDPAIPGYLPSEIFLHCKNKDLMSITCQRCHFMKNYNTMLSINVDPDLYPKLLAKIKDEFALILLMVDLTDFPCSIWPGILDIIGKKRPLFIVGNKIDLLWPDCKSWLENVRNLLRSSFPANANVQHVSLISAKTGFGVEQLINKLHNIWQYKGNVYLIGCTNVGKSTLFNALLQSDYCKVKAVDLLQRATTAPWPGTTLNLLKFPILRPDGWRLYLRTIRLINDQKKASYEEKLTKELKKSMKIKSKELPQIIGHIGRTFGKKPNANEINSNDNFAMPNRREVSKSTIMGSGLDPDDRDFLNSKWFYDTPGVLHKEQILDLLTTEELMLTLPKTVIQPRTFIIRPGWTTFIAGLARLDYIEGHSRIRITIFSSSSLPITICEIDNAEKVYNQLLGTKYMLVPQGSQERLKYWPNLTCGQQISLIGINPLVCCADIVLSSSGWISITPETKEICKFKPWTPLSRGVHVRSPSLLPNIVNLRGKKSRRIPAYRETKPIRQ